MTSKEKLDNVLGISSNLSIDDVLNDLTKDIDNSLEELAEIDSNIKDNIAVIDNELKKYNSDPSTELNISKIDTSLNEVADMISTSKSILKHVYTAITGTDLVDPEVVDSYSKLVEANHLSVKEFVDLYKSRVAFYDKVRLQQMQFEQKKELLKLKYELESKRLEQKKDVIPENMKTFSQEDIIKALNNADKVAEYGA